jgi:hypothetical protein
VLRLSDLPAGFNIVAGETIPTPLAVVLADPWSAAHESLIRRERVAGYQTSFWSPERRRIECEAAVYRSSDGAGQVFRGRLARYESFLRTSGFGGSVPAAAIGEETRAHRYVIKGQYGFAVMWRDHNVLAVCGTQGPRLPDPSQIILIAALQEARIAHALTRRPQTSD